MNNTISYYFNNKICPNCSKRLTYNNCSCNYETNLFIFLGEEINFTLNNNRFNIIKNKNIFIIYNVGYYEFEVNDILFNELIEKIETYNIFQ